MTKTNTRKVPEDLSHGDRIIFSQEMGGSGEVVTVVSVRHADGGFAYIQVDEKPFPILAWDKDPIELSS